VPGSTTNSAGTSPTTGRPGTADTGSTGRWTEILTFIDWTALPARTQPIARMLTDGFTQKQIAAKLERSEEWVSGRVKELRDAMVDQALARTDELSTELRALIDTMRG
jgi:DNA-binding NarL/FixJ family response regulator